MKVIKKLHKKLCDERAKLYEQDELLKLELRLVSDTCQDLPDMYAIRFKYEKIESQISNRRWLLSSCTNFLDRTIKFIENPFSVSKEERA